MDTLLNLFNSGFTVIVPFIVLLGALIFVHELGHFSVAKFFGVRVEVFSLGFGRKLIQRKRGDTVYCISAIPFGGYVKMFGDDPSAEIPDSEKKFSFLHQPVLPRIAIVLAGPLMNAIFAFILFVIISGVGEEMPKAKLGDVHPGTMAYQSGFRTNDLITSVNDTAIDRWDILKKTIDESPDKPLKMSILRENKPLELTVVPVSVANKNVLSNRPIAGEIDGFSYLHRASSVGVSDPLSPAYRAGIRTGDIIKKVNDRDLTKWTELVESLKSSTEKMATLVIDRNGKTMTVQMEVEKNKPLGGMDPSDLFLTSVVAKSAAEEAGILPGDKLLNINGTALQRFEDVVKIVQAFNETSRPLKVEYLRSGKIYVTEISPRMMSHSDQLTGIEKKNFALGVVAGPVYAPPETFIAKEASVGKMISNGFEDTVHWTHLTAMGLVKMVTGKVSAKSIGGPLMIGKLASDTWRVGLSPFLKIMAIISLNLFLLNLLPIPVLDGGHLLLFGIEAVKGSPLSLKKVEILHQVGMVLLLALMVFAVFNDILRIFKPT